MGIIQEVFGEYQRLKMDLKTLKNYFRGGYFNE